jgi:hypothetical protein
MVGGRQAGMLPDQCRLTCLLGGKRPATQGDLLAQPRAREGTPATSLRHTGELDAVSWDRREKPPLVACSGSLRWPPAREQRVSEPVSPA